MRCKGASRHKITRQEKQSASTGSCFPELGFGAAAAAVATPEASFVQPGVKDLEMR
jgi:hypothetical protein